MKPRDVAAAGAAFAALWLLVRAMRPRATPAPARPSLTVRYPVGVTMHPAAPAVSSPVTLPGAPIAAPVSSDWTFAPNPIPSADLNDPAPAPVVIEPQSPNIVLSESQKAANVEAFMMMIRFAEHDADTVRSGQDFTTFYGGSRFSNLSDHPALTGEKKGVKLPDSYCKAAGLPPGCVSTAAGALQMNAPTWQEIRAWGGPRLPDFSPSSQLEAGRRLLAKIGALEDVRNGKFADAVFKASKRWASLPGSAAAQAKRTPAFVLAAYEASGGTYA